MLFLLQNKPIASRTSKCLSSWVISTNEKQEIVGLILRAVDCLLNFRHRRHIFRDPLTVFATILGAFQKNHPRTDSIYTDIFYDFHNGIISLENEKHVK
jgi:hypothetical protein